jgi:guanylate kinase
LFVLAGPSGAGKTTLAHHLVDSCPATVFSVSMTTRPLRGSETDGHDYFFVSDDEFDRRVKDGFFLEWALVHGNRYGTSIESVRESIAAGLNVVLDIDVQGAFSVKKAIPDAVLIFILPPSAELLESRLVSRSTDSTETVRKRMETASLETRWLGVFDYYICNDEVDEAREKIEAIHRAELSRLWSIPYPAEARLLEPERFVGREFWAGRRVVVTAGPTREYIDDVRFLSNRSSGLMGYSLAMAFRDAGSSVVLISGACSAIPPPPMMEFISFESARELENAIRSVLPRTDMLAMNAAVSDFVPSRRLPGKTGRRAEGMDLHLDRTTDILESISSSESDLTILAYALEYGPEAEMRAMKKMSSKGVDAIFLNRGDIEGAGMETPGNEGVLIMSDGLRTEIPFGSKRFVAEATVAALGYRLGSERS